MCGILAYYGNINKPRSYYLNESKKLRHRGPDWNGIYMNKHVVLCHERLSIVGVDSGSQPLISQDGRFILTINGEIYNYKDLYNIALKNKYTSLSQSDCEVILYLYQEYGIQMLSMLDGVFSFVLYDSLKNTLLIARDPLGINPLYIGICQSSKSNESNDTIIDLKGETFVIASELKALHNCDVIEYFKPGHYCNINDTSDNVFIDTSMITINEYNPYYKPKWYTKLFNYNNYLKDSVLLEQLEFKIKDTLIQAVDKRLMTDVPFGVLLSGGLDSSLIASIASRLLKNKTNSFGNKLHTFSIGLKDSPDLKAAQNVATFLDTIHHELLFTVQDGIDCIRDLIYHLETFDVTTIRASTPMFLMSRKIKSYGIKMVLSGEGADEIFGGYLYFHKAPNADEFNKECYKRVTELHHFDCLRANKSTMAWGLEARVPFLDKRMLELCMPIHAHNKCKNIEKYILRKAFDSKHDPYLPSDVLWRQKEQFTDGVGYNWLDTLIEHCNASISDDEFIQLQERFKTDNYPILTKEEAYYRKLFEEFFPNKSSIIKRWIPQMSWDGVGSDPSGRAQSVHLSHTAI